MEINQTKRTKIPLWVWLHLLGLEAPLGAIIWAEAFCNILDLNHTPFRIYQFLFVAVWCMTMITRLTRVIQNSPGFDERPELYFMKSNWIVFSLLTFISAGCGIWMISFQVGAGVISLAWVPLILCLLYFLKTLDYRKTSFMKQTLMPFYAAAAFCTGISIPAFFYSLPYSNVQPLYIPEIRLFFYPPILYLTSFVYLVMMTRSLWEHDEEEKSHLGIVCSIAMLLFFIVCISSNYYVIHREFWFFKSLGVGIASLYILDRFKHSFSSEARHSLSWGILVFPAILIIIFLKSPF